MTKRLGATGDHQLRSGAFCANEGSVNQPSPSSPVVIPEVLPPEGKGGGGPSLDPKAPRVIIEPLAALALIVMDNLWFFPEFIVVDWVFTIPLCFLTVFTITYLVQRRRAGDRRRVALAKALVLGVVAAVPTSLTGTPVGLALLAWAGIRHPWRS